MRTRQIKLSFLYFVIGLLTINAQQVSSRMATVHIILLNSQGDDVGIGTVASFQEENEGSKDLRSRFKDNNASSIPFGTYHLRVFTKGYSSAYRTVSVHQREVWVVVQLNVGQEDGPLFFTISGTIQGLSPSNKQLWIRAQGLYSSVIADTRVDRSGNFELAGLPAGIYILSTRRDNSVLDIRSVVVPPPEQKQGTTVQVRIKIKIE